MATKPSSSSSSSSSSSFVAVDGIRAITHLSLIALHASMVATAHLPSEGPIWKAVRASPVYTFMQAGNLDRILS